MEDSTWIICLLIFIVLWYLEKRKKEAVQLHIKQKRRRLKGGVSEMEEIIAKYMNKGANITTIDGSECGKVISFQNGWVTLLYRGREININSEYIVQVEDYKLPKERKK